MGTNTFFVLPYSDKLIYKHVLHHVLFAGYTGYILKKCVKAFVKLEINEKGKGVRCRLQISPAKANSYVRI